MFACPLCNALKVLEVNCPKCDTPLEDTGKVSDFLDPYGHYNDEETVKRGDGYLYTAKDHQCPHLMVCSHCQYDVVKFIQEE